MDSRLSRLNAINKLRDELGELRSPNYPWKFGEGRFKKWDLFHRKSVLLFKSLFGENHQYVHDWQKIKIPEDPGFDAEDQDFSEYLNNQGIAEDKMENQLEVMANDIALTIHHPETARKATKRKSRKKVFIVHGKDHEPVDELKVILKELNIKTLVLEELPCGSKTIVEKLEMYSNVDFAFVILTPDDKGCQTGVITNLVASFMSATNPPTSGAWLQMLEPRARENALLEFGYFIGKIGRDKVCYLRKEPVKVPSDMNGIAYIPFIDSVSEIKQKILEELAQSGVIKL